MTVQITDCKSAQDVRDTYARIAAWKRSLAPRQSSPGIAVMAKPETRGSMNLPHWVLCVIARDYGVTVSEIQCCLRDERLVEPRHVAMLLLRDAADMMVIDIARELHRTHPTVCKGIAKVRKRMAEDQVFAARIENLKAECLK